MVLLLIVKFNPLFPFLDVMRKTAHIFLPLSDELDHMHCQSTVVADINRQFLHFGRAQVEFLMVQPVESSETVDSVLSLLDSAIAL
jgi:hypothetical protein